MKKVGILTYHRSINYGAVLQSYSLVNYLRKCIPDVSFEIIDYTSSIEAHSYIKKTVSFLLKHLDLQSAKGELKKKNVFKAFSNTLPVSKKRFQSDDITKLNNYINKNYDLVISGSDAIFNWSGQKFPTAFFLHDVETKKMTYAASAHRLFYRDVDAEKIKYVFESINGLNYFGARDRETEQLARYSGYKGEIHHNCDPAWLLDINSIHSQVDEKVILKKCGIVDDRPIIIVMTPNSRVANVIKNKYEKDYNLVSLFINNKVIENTVFSLTPFEWATLFSKAKLTVTEYFHATILSLLNGTAVLSLDSLDYTLGYEGKIKDLLNTRLNLPELYLNKKELLEKGEGIIVEKAEEILCSFNQVTVKNNIEKERYSVNSFVESVKGLLD